MTQRVEYDYRLIFATTVCAVGGFTVTKMIPCRTSLDDKIKISLLYIVFEWVVIETERKEISPPPQISAYFRSPQNSNFTE